MEDSFQHIPKKKNRAPSTKLGQEYNAPTLCVAAPKCLLCTSGGKKSTSILSLRDVQFFVDRSRNLRERMLFWKCDFDFGHNFGIFITKMSGNFSILKCSSILEICGEGKFCEWRFTNTHWRINAWQHPRSLNKFVVRKGCLLNCRLAMADCIYLTVQWRMNHNLSLWWIFDKTLQSAWRTLWTIYHELGVLV